MINYFNYFTEIERFYQAKRESFTLLSTLDWVLIENWKERGIPLDVVMKGIERAFDRPNSKRRINSLAYCSKAVEEICDEQKDLLVEKPAMPEVPVPEIAAYMNKLAEGVAKLALSVPEFAPRFETIAGTIRAMDASNLRDAEQELTALEEKLIALLKVACDEKILLEVKREVDGDLNPFRSTMTTERLAMLEQQLWRRKLMERYDVPRLSLFYLI